MSIQLLRRISGLVPLPVTSAPAPVLGPPVDVSPPPPPPKPVPAPQERVLVPPSYTPGVCHHDAHIDYDGRRIGVLVLDEDSATLLPCQHSNRDGR